MSAAERWSEIEQLFGSLFELPAEDQQRALADVEDLDLRTELQVLLTTHHDLTSRHDAFLSAIDSARAGALLVEARAADEEPSTIGRYRIVRRLGRGGMGIVYLAHDPRLDRPVAVKLLPAYRNADPASVRRLREEARAASALDHPHIGTVYEIGESADDRVFIAMAYYNGETLRERIGRGPLPVPDVIDLGTQLAGGLSAAHRRRIVHRDIKPENILVTKDGLLKIVDFGVAQIMEEGLPTAGIPLGTAAYMSPEQTRGEALDHRTDVWSAGVVLYELLTGARPFRGDGEALIHAICNDPPPSMSAVRSGLPPRLVSCVERCLEKDRERRFDSADALASALREVARTDQPGETRAAAWPWRRYARLAAVVAAPLMLVAGILVRGGGDVPPPPPTATASPGIAVLPFDVRGEEFGALREGMVDLLSISLDGAAGLRAIDSRTVFAGWRQAEQRGGTPDLARALDVARALGARYAVIGSVVSSGSDIRLGAQIYSLQDGTSLASLQVEGSPDSLFALVDRLSIDVLAAVWQGREQPRRAVDLTRITTTSLPALKAYLEGESLLRRSDFGGAVAAYERAVTADSTFAFALYHLGLAATWIGDVPLQLKSFRRALDVGRLPEREALIVRATLGYHSRVHDVPTSIALFQEATRKYPDDIDAWYFLAESYHHAGDQALVSRDEGEKAFRKLLELDPGFAPAYVHLINNAFLHHPDSARAASLIEEYRGLAPNTRIDQENRIAFALAFGDSLHRREAAAALDTLPLTSLTTLTTDYFDHPRFWGLRSRVLGLGRREATYRGGRLIFQRADTDLGLGKIRGAVEHLQDPLLFPQLRLAGLYALHDAGYSLPGVDLDEILALPEPDNVAVNDTSAIFRFHPGAHWFYPGAYAADQGRWDDHAAAIGHLRAEADRFLAQGDTATSRVMAGAALALKGQGLWRQGDVERALPLLVQGQVQTTWTMGPTHEAVNATIRWWIAEALLESGRYQDAARYFESFWDSPWSAARLGPIYERLGNRAKAREAYALVATAWREADPELRPRVRQALAAMRRLDPLARG